MPALTTENDEESIPKESDNCKEPIPKNGDNFEVSPPKNSPYFNELKNTNVVLPGCTSTSRTSERTVCPEASTAPT